MLKFDRSALLRHAAASTALTGALLLVPQAALAQDLPTGEMVVSGGASIGGDDNLVRITQTTDRAVINWSSFNVGAGKSVLIEQGGNSRALLNRVTGTTASTIAGTITSDGSVYLVNPNGIAITSTGSVQTGGSFVASTLDITNADFQNNVLKFTGTGASKGVSNAGSIVSGALSSNGIVALLGGTVSHGGSIQLSAGRVALGSGEAITLDVNGGQFLQVAVPTTAATGGATALIEMSDEASIVTRGGRVEIRAATAADAVRNVINMAGFVDTGMTGAGTRITVQGTGGGLVRVGGTLLTRGEGVDGGGISIAGAAVDITGLYADTRSDITPPETLSISARQLPIDAGFADALSDNLSRNNVMLRAVGTGGTGGGTIALNGALAWDNTTLLTLQAGSIALNSAIASYNGKLTLEAGGSTAGAITATGAIDIDRFRIEKGNWVQNAAALPGFQARNFGLNLADASLVSFLRVTGGDGSVATPYRIADIYGLQGIASRNLLSRNFVIVNDISANSYDWNDGAGFLPIGTADSPFTGTLDGRLANGRSANISTITIRRPDERYTGLFGLTSNARLSNLTLFADIAGATIAGGLVGHAAGGTIIRNVSVGGYVAAQSRGGGVVGMLTESQIIDAFANADVSASIVTGEPAVFQLGGLVGYQRGGSITGSYTYGRTSGDGYVGGLVGWLTGNGTIDMSFARGEVRGGDSTGGLVGAVGDGATGATVTNSYATGSVTGDGDGAIGGLVGSQFAGSTIRNVYASGAVTGQSGGTSGTGGLIGRQRGGSLTFAYATGTVNGDGPTGGLIGVQGTNGVVANVWASGIASGSGLTGGLIGESSGQVGNAYWDGWTNSNAFGNGAVVAATVRSVSSDPARSGQADYAYGSASYANLAGASGIGTAGVSGFAFMPGNSTRPFLAFEVPSATSTRMVNGAWTIVNAHQLQLIGYNAATLRTSYRVGTYIDAFETGLNVGAEGSGSTMWNFNGFVPIGTDGLGNVFDGTTFKAMGAISSGKYGFTGTFDGTGSVISDVKSYRPGVSYIGLFGVTQGTLTNVRVENIDLFGGGVVGGLVGYIYRGGSVTGSYAYGIAQSQGGILGGLVGAATAGTRVTQSNAGVEVYGTTNVGGLIGYATGATVSRSYASSFVSGTQYVGGLIGYSYQTATDNSYARGVVSGSVGSVGGLIGKIVGGSVTNTYSQASAGGGGRDIGGLIGKADASARIVSSYWDIDASGNTTSAGGAGRTAEQMADKATYVGWNFDTIWFEPGRDSESGYIPILRRPQAPK